MRDIKPEVAFTGIFIGWRGWYVVVSLKLGDFGSS